ncbi:MAG: cation:proton antiporter, partial [archaeon]
VIGILSDGGLHLDLKYVVKEGFVGMLLMMAGLVTTTIGITFFLSSVGFPVLFALLVSVTLAGTSGSVIIPVIQSLSFVSDRIKTILSIESISDTFSIVIALFLLDILSNTGIAAESVEVLLQSVSLELLSAIAIGIIFGLLWGPVIGKLKGFDYSYAATLGALILLFALSEAVGSSGAIAVFFAGVMLANAHTIYKALFPEFEFERLDEDIERTHALFAFLIRVFFFVFLGAVVGIPNPYYLFLGTVITGIIIGARILYVNGFIRLNLLRMSEKEKWLVYFMVPRGLSAAVLAIFAFAAGISMGEEMVSIVFSVIIASVLVSTVATFVLSKNEKNVTKKGALTASKVALD